MKKLGLSLIMAATMVATFPVWSNDPVSDEVSDTVNSTSQASDTSSVNSEQVAPRLYHPYHIISIDRFAYPRYGLFPLGAALGPHLCRYINRFYINTQQHNT